MLVGGVDGVAERMDVWSYRCETRGEGAKGLGWVVVEGGGKGVMADWGGWRGDGERRVFVRVGVADG